MRQFCHVCFVKSGIALINLESLVFIAFFFICQFLKTNFPNLPLRANLFYLLKTVISILQTNLPCIYFRRKNFSQTKKF